MAAPATRLVPDDSAFVGHTGVVVVLRRGDLAAGRAQAAALVGVDGVHGVWTLESVHRAGLDLDLVFAEGDATAVAGRTRDARPCPPSVEVAVDAPFDLVEPLRYPWADDIRRSFLPATVG